MKKWAYLTVALFAVQCALGQVFTAPLGDPIYWDARPETDVDEYGVFRSAIPCTDPTPNPTTCPAFVQVATVPQAADPINWTEPGPITFVQDYFYRVTARNTSGLESQFSNELNVRWLNPLAPGAPGSLRGLEQGANMRLDWDEPDPTEQVELWRIYKSDIEEETGNHIMSVAQNSYRDKNQGRVGPKWYRVTALNPVGESAPAGPVQYVGK
jgi:hypothetical protein